MRKNAELPWWPFALFAVVSVAGLDLIDSDRAVVVRGTYGLIGLGSISACFALYLWCR